MGKDESHCYSWLDTRNWSLSLDPDLDPDPNVGELRWKLMVISCFLKFDARCPPWRDSSGFSVFDFHDRSWFYDSRPCCPWGPINMCCQPSSSGFDPSTYLQNGVCLKIGYWPPNPSQSIGEWLQGDFFSSCSLWHLMATWGVFPFSEKPTRYW